VSRIRLVLADDHTLVRAGIRSLLEKIPGAEVVGETENGREALELIGTLRPDVALLDIGIPDLNGLEVAERTAGVSPRTRVVILSMHADAVYVRQALRAGVSGYLLKGAAVAELPLALESVMRGETYLTPKVSHHVVQGFLRESDPQAGLLDELTGRQREILQLIAEGHSMKEVAHRLNLSVKTVETHRTRMMDRLGIHDVAGLVRLAVRAGLVPPV
jgi:DNA-binding NarL/FixJ family response regulator